MKAPLKMTCLLSATLFFLVGALGSLLCREEKGKKLWALGGVCAGSVSGLIPVLFVLGGKGSLAAAFGGTLPTLTFHIGLDPLSAFFLVPILGLSSLAALYAWGYLKGQKQLLATLPFFPILVASMTGIVIARDGFLFLIVWEIMSLSSFFLVTAEHGEREVRHAGWIYLAATHLGTAFLLAFFVLLFQKTGSFAFQDFVFLRPGPVGPFLFVFAVIGFGTKAGLFPFHFWLPHAHPAAPSYISALMSGVMIKTGIYGLVRTLTFFQSLPLWCGELLILLGITSAVLGVLYALMQHDLKKLLAYSSVENIGIILAGIGLGLIGRSLNRPLVEILGFGGALFHLLNHSLFKGLLFLGAGNILHATHSRRIDQMGGLMRQMPKTGITFLVASVAICGLPPLNGFLSEWLLFLGFFEGIQNFSQTPFFLCVASIISIALAGGLTVACFTRAFGAAFLGNPRVSWKEPIQEGTWQQYVPMGILSLLCILLGLFPSLALPWLTAVLSDLNQASSFSAIGSPLAALGTVSLAFAFPIGLFLIGYFLRSRMLSTQTNRTGLTWDCGLDQPTPRMQYTAASYAEPLGTFFRFLLKLRIQFQKPEGLFPTRTSFEEHLEDLVEKMLVNPATRRMVQTFSWIRRRQKNQVQNYLAYIFATLLLLLVWEVWIGI